MTSVEWRPSRCSICPGTRRCVQGDGPLDARCFFIGEAPGKTEDYGGRPFIGDAGREFNENYLQLAGLARDDIYITNTVKCRPDQNRKPYPAEVAACSSHFLKDELELVQPEIVFLMGATACSLVPSIDLEAEHGIPQLGELFGWEGWLVPINHPAAGLHDSTMMIPMLEDWQRLYRWLKYGDWQWPLDDSVKDYGLIETKAEAEEFFHHCFWLPDPLLIGGDTESHGGEPYSWQLSLEPNVARMIMLRNKEVCKLASNWLADLRWTCEHSYVFHHALADLDIFETQLGYRIENFDDTMQQAYHFGNLPQALKSLCRRLLGRKRLSWDETVTPYSKVILADWLMNGFIYAEREWQTVSQTYHKKTGKPNKPKVTRSETEKLIVELMGYMMNNPQYKIWDKVRERMGEKELGQLEFINGRMPVKGIAHCPIDVQIDYACSDPDDTRALAVLFKQIRQEFIEGLCFQTEDRDA